jgi:anhydro-N-acetylmuramic acid kinase
MIDERKRWDAETWVLGLMSGTSRDGIDAALLRSDGRGMVEPGGFLSRPYDEAFRADLATVCGGGAAEPALAEVERALTLRHAEVVRELLASHGIAPEAVGVIGFHGHTVEHAPDEGRTRQIGDGRLLAAETGIDVVCDFRSRDVAAGGQGAPFAPLYHMARSLPLERPLAVLNVGGVANATWIGAGDLAALDEAALDASRILAFDTGPGNALIDDWVAERTGTPFDRDGVLAAAGQVAEAVVEALLGHPYFDRQPPKSLDRDDFDLSALAGLSTADGAATLAAFTAAALARARDHFPAPPGRWLVSGGGRRNPVLMEMIARRTGAPVAPVESVGWNGDAVEAEAFAYLAVRSLKGLALSLPSTTGVPAPITGGRFHRAERG